jgi:hypothetical protein
LTYIHYFHVSPINEKYANRLFFIVNVSDFNSRPHISPQFFYHPKGSYFRLCDWNGNRVFIQDVEALNKRLDDSGNLLAEVNIKIAW